MQESEKQFNTFGAPKLPREKKPLSDERTKKAEETDEEFFAGLSEEEKKLWKTIRGGGGSVPDNVKYGEGIIKDFLALKGEYPEKVRVLLDKVSKGKKGFSSIEPAEREFLLNYLWERLGWRQSISEKKETGLKTKVFVAESVTLGQPVSATNTEVSKDKEEKEVGYIPIKNLKEFLGKNESLAVVSDFYCEIIKRKNWDKTDLDALKGHLISRHPDSIEEIQVAASFIRLLIEQFELDRSYRNYDPEANKNLAEYNFLLTHFLTTASMNFDYWRGFWSAMRAIARHANVEGGFLMAKAGIIGQAAVYKILRNLHEAPSLSTPKEDVYYKVDVWTAGTPETQRAVQVKSSVATLEGFLVEETEWLNFPSVTKRSKNRETHFIESNFKRLSKFSASVDKFRESSGKKNIRAMYVILPQGEINYFNGEPSERLVANFKTKLASTEMKSLFKQESSEDQKLAA